MRDFAQQLSPRWTGFVSEKRFSEGIFRKSDFGIQRVTKPLLYQLSYVGAKRKKLHPATAAARAKLRSKLQIPSSNIQRIPKFQGRDRSDFGFDD